MGIEEFDPISQPKRLKSAAKLNKSITRKQKACFRCSYN